MYLNIYIQIFRDFSLHKIFEILKYSPVPGLQDQFNMPYFFKPLKYLNIKIF